MNTKPLYSFETTKEPYTRNDVALRCTEKVATITIDLCKSLNTLFCIDAVCRNPEDDKVWYERSFGNWKTCKRCLRNSKTIKELLQRGYYIEVKPVLYNTEVVFGTFKFWVIDALKRYRLKLNIKEDVVVWK